MASRNDRRTRTTRGSSSRMSSRSAGQSSRAARANAQSSRPTRTHATQQVTRSTGAKTTRRTARETAPAQDAPSTTRGVKAVPGGRLQNAAPEIQPQLVSTSVRELRQAERNERLRKSSQRYVVRLVIIIGIVVALLAGWAVLYNSPAFTIENVEVNGVEHLTSDEMAQLANVPEGATLLRVDTDSIRNRLMQTAWVEDVEVKRAFPSTLIIDVTERSIKAVVEIPTSSGSAVKQWAIAEDHMWLMPIPEAGTDAAKTTSAQIYEDAEAALHIVDVPYGTKAEIGKICSDNNVNNALDIVSGMTTELAGRVVKVSAAGPAETTLVLDNGVEIAFGKAEDIRDKERVILKILQDNPDGVAYINVRMVEQPTWRAV